MNIREAKPPSTPTPSWPDLSKPETRGLTFKRS
jgi:hypothetical protein